MLAILLTVGKYELTILLTVGKSVPAVPLTVGKGLLTLLLTVGISSINRGNKLLHSIYFSLFLVIIT
jgi:hypothetical protein